MDPNQLLSFVVPYLKTTSNVALASSVLYNWMETSGHSVKSSKTDLCIDNRELFLSLGFPEAQMSLHAATIGDLDLLKRFLVEYPHPGDYKLYTVAAEQGHLHILDWLWERGYGCPYVAPAFAAAGGQIKALEWLQKKGVQSLGFETATAASHGHLQVLKWMVSQGYRTTEFICHHAAKNGHLHILEYSKELGIPFNKQTWLSAIAGGHDKVLKWLEENGCPKT